MTCPLWISGTLSVICSDSAFKYSHLQLHKAITVMFTWQISLLSLLGPVFVHEVYLRLSLWGPQQIPGFWMTLRWKQPSTRWRLVTYINDAKAMTFVVEDTWPNDMHFGSFCGLALNFMAWSFIDACRQSSSISTNIHAKMHHARDYHQNMAPWLDFQLLSRSDEQYLSVQVFALDTYSISSDKKH